MVFIKFENDDNESAENNVVVGMKLPGSLKWKRANEKSRGFFDHEFKVS
jgi:hypothetical protein